MLDSHVLLCCMFLSLCMYFFHPTPPLADLSRSTMLNHAGRICGDGATPRLGVWPNCGSRSRGYSQGVRQEVGTGGQGGRGALEVQELVAKHSIGRRAGGGT